MIVHRTLGCALALVSAAACGSETGIVIEVTRDPQTTDRIDELQFFVGERQSGNFVDSDPEPLVPIAGRDLVADPYRLLLRPGERSDRFQVAVVGRAAGELVAFGALEEPIEFQDGSVIKWTIVLTGGSGPVVTDTGCLRWDGGEIASSKDRDCDGFDGEEDCDDDDPSVYPGAPEYCGSGDSSCYGKPLEHEPCFLTIDSRCLNGVVACQGDGGRGECRLHENEKLAPPEFCAAYDACLEQGAADLYGCTLDMVGAKSHVCTLYHQDDAHCGRAEAALPVLQPAPCEWLVASGGSTAYLVRLYEILTGEGGQTQLQSCNPRFELVPLSDMFPPPRERFLFAGRAGDQRTLVDVRVRPQEVDDCPSLALECDGLAPP